MTQGHGYSRAKARARGFCVRGAMASLALVSIPAAVFMPLALADTPSAAPPTAVPSAGSGSDAGASRHDPDNKMGLAEWMDKCIQGNAKYLAHDIPGAIDLYRQAIQLAPKRPLPHYLLAEAELGANNFGEADVALTDADQASDERDPNTRGKILFLVADTREREKKWDEARAAWTAYGEFAAKHADAGVTPATPPARIQAIDDMLKQDKAYEVVRQRIADAMRDSGPPPPEKKK